MTTVMTPSEITVGQIGKFQELIGAALRKSDLQSAPFQLLLEKQGEPLAAELLSVIRKRVEMVSNLIVRRVEKVDRARAPGDTLRANGRTVYCNDDVVAAMPRGEGDEVEIVFFKVRRYISDADLDNEYESHGLKPADPYSLAAFNEADPAFADDRPHATHWKDAQGNWCYAAFCRWVDERKVRVYRDDYDWSDSWWFAGLRK